MNFLYGLLVGIGATVVVLSLLHLVTLKSVLGELKTFLTALEQKLGQKL